MHDVTSEEIAARIETCHETVRTLYDYWSAKRGDRAMPRRADIDPAEVKRCLPMMMLIDVTADERRFVYLPLSEDGDAVNMILVYSHSYSYKRRTKPGSVT